MKLTIVNLGMEAQYRIIKHVREMIQDLENDLEEMLTGELAELAADPHVGKREIQDSLRTVGNEHSSEFNRLWDILWKAIDGTLDYGLAHDIYVCIED